MEPGLERERQVRDEQVRRYAEAIRETAGRDTAWQVWDEQVRRHTEATRETAGRDTA